MQNVGYLAQKTLSMPVGTKVNLTLKRGDKEVEVTETLQPTLVKHVFKIDPNPTPEQLKLREAWMKNL